jgi:hypothetical protein
MPDKKALVGTLVPLYPALPVEVYGPNPMKGCLNGIPVVEALEANP